MSETQNCPKCGFAVSGAAFGMSSCSNCGEIFMLGGDMEPQIFDSPAPPLPPPPKALDLSQPAPAASQKEETRISPAEHNKTSMFDAGGEAEEPTRTKVQEATASFHDVVEFGNSEQPSSSNGALVYELKIFNIDTSNLRDSITECLSDARLGLDVRLLFARMDKGTLVIPRLNPVKAAVLVGKLKHLPLKISWTSQQLVKLSKVILFVIGSSLVWNLILAHKAMGEEWGRHEINLKGYQTKISNGEEELRDLITKKNKNKDPQVRDELLKEIIKKNDDLKKTFKDMKAEEEHIRFQHPEQGDQSLRKYRHVRLKSIQELENEVGLDGQLSRLKHKVKTKFEQKE